MTIQIMKTFKESFKHVREHKLEWFKVAFAPIMISVAGLVLAILFFIAAGIEANQIFEGKVEATNLDSFAKFLGVSGIVIYFICFIITIVSLYINGYRYAVLNEGGDQWWVFHLDRRFVKMILYSLLMILLLGVYLIVSVGIFGGAAYLFQNTALNIILGVVIGLYGFYLIFRLGLLFLLIAIDKQSVLKSSWHLMKGNVLRFIGLMLLLGIVLTLINFVGTFLFSLIGMISSTLAIVSSILSTLFGLFMWLVNWAVISKATARVYQALTETT
mgnify:CR=1 FL=1